MAFFVQTIVTFLVALMFAYLAWSAVLSGRFINIGPTRRHEPIAFWACVLWAAAVALLSLAFTGGRVWALAVTI